MKHSSKGRDQLNLLLTLVFVFTLTAFALVAGCSKPPQVVLPLNSEQSKLAGYPGITRVTANGDGTTTIAATHVTSGKRSWDHATIMVSDWTVAVDSSGTVTTLSVTGGYSSINGSVGSLCPNICPNYKLH